MGIWIAGVASMVMIAGALWLAAWDFRVQSKRMVPALERMGW
jgi:hypothetical protein